MRPKLVAFLKDGNLHRTLQWVHDTRVLMAPKHRAMWTNSGENGGGFKPQYFHPSSDCHSFSFILSALVLIVMAKRDRPNVSDAW